MLRFPKLFILLAAVFILVSCGKTEETNPYPGTWIEGQVTVDAELDTIRDYSGFELKIIETYNTGQTTDTLFHSVTDRDGYYAGEARFPEADLYTLTLSRHGDDLVVVDLVLAEGDTVRFSPELPDVGNAAVVESVENELFDSYKRLQRGVNRLFQFASAGQVSADTLSMELQKWSDLFWDFYEENKDSFAGRQSAASSIRLLEGLDDELMMQRLQSVVEEDHTFAPFASTIGTRYHAGRQGLDSALTYLDSLRHPVEDERISMELKRNRIKLLYDSARVELARNELELFKEQFSNIGEASDWIDRFEYDLTKLAPGSELPYFEIVTTQGDTLSRDSKRGSPYILEFTRLDNRLYQDQFDRNIAIHHIYKNYGIDFVTIPFGANEVVLNAFFEERVKLWPFAMPGSIDASELRERFNLNTIPTRILVDRNGLVVRKYEGTEFADIIRGLQIVLYDNNGEEPS